jgi:ribosome production factor 2
MDGFGSQLGRVHMQKMDLSKLQTRKMKGLKQKSWSSASQDDVEPESTPDDDQAPPAKKRKVTNREKDVK